MANIGTLSVTIQARTQKFEQGFKRARKTLGGFAKNVKTTLGPVATLTTGVTGLSVAFGAAGLAGSIGMAAQRIDSLAKTSDKLGIATENLAGLRFAGEQTGVAINTLDMALQRMVRRVSEAAIGLGEAQGALRELGLSATQLNRLAPDQQFAAIAEAMARVTGESDKLRLAFKLFDSEGVALVNTLALGRQGLEDMQTAAENLGIAIGRDEARKVEEMNDAVNRLSKSFEGLANTLTVSVAPALTETFDLITKILSDKDVRQAFLFGIPRPGFEQINRQTGEIIGQTGAAGQLTPAERRRSERSQMRDRPEFRAIRDFGAILGRLTTRIPRPTLSAGIAEAIGLTGTGIARLQAASQRIPLRGVVGGPAMGRAGAMGTRTDIEQPLRALERGTVEAFTASLRNLQPRTENELKKQTGVLEEMLQIMERQQPGEPIKVATLEN